MNVDNYQLRKSSEPQSRHGFTPFTDKQSNQYISDTNSGVYSNSGQSLVQFDLSQIYNSSRWTSTDDMFLTIPLIMVAAYSSGVAAPVAPSTSASYSLVSLKNGFHHLIHQADLVIDGKTIHDSQPFLNIHTHIKLLSEMSYTDLLSSASVLGMSDSLDSENSMVWNATGGANLSGDGLTNNVGLNPTAANAFGYGIQQTLNPVQGFRVANKGLLKRQSKYLDTTAGQLTRLTTLVSASKLINDFRPTHYRLNDYLVWQDTAVIRLRDIFDSMDKIGLVKKLNCQLRLYVNTGALSVGVTTPSNVATGYNTFSAASSTFSNTCPITINHLADTVVNGGIPATVTHIVAGCFIQRPAVTSLNGINLASSGASHAMPSCRIYYSSIQMDPVKELKYIEQNSPKTVVYKNYIFNQYSGVTAGGNFSAIVQAGVSNPYALVIVPMIATSAQSGHSSYGSPYDTCPGSFSPLQISNLSVQLGGVQVLQQNYSYGFESFLTQVNNNESDSGADWGLGVGLVSSSWWSNNRYYWVNLSRSAPSDRVVPRSINLSFTNNSDVAMDVLVFTVFLDEVSIDVSKGLVQKV